MFIRLTLSYALIIFMCCGTVSANSLSHDEKVNFCLELEKAANAEYRKMGITPQVYTIKLVYNPKNSSMNFHYFGSMVQRNTVEFYRDSMIAQAGIQGALQAYRTAGFRSLVFHLNGKSCVHQL